MNAQPILDQHTAEHLARWCITETFVAADRAAMADAIVAFLAAAPDAAARKNLLHLGWPTLYQLARDAQDAQNLAAMRAARQQATEEAAHIADVRAAVDSSPEAR